MRGTTHFSGLWSGADQIEYMLNNMMIAAPESENSTTALGIVILALATVGLCLWLFFSIRGVLAASSLRTRASAIAGTAFVLVILEAVVFGFVRVFPVDTATITSIFSLLVIATLVVAGGAWLFARWLPAGASEPGFRFGPHLKNSLRDLMLGLRSGKTVVEALVAPQREPILEPVRPAVFRRGLGPALAFISLLAMVAILRAFANPTMPYSDVLVGYFGLAGGSILLASLPAFIVGWFILSWLAERPQVAAALRDAGDLAGRGLIVGLLIGCLGFLSTFLPGADKAAGITGTIESFVDLSVTGTIVGFYLSLFLAIKRACEASSRPAVAFAASPLALAALMVGSLQLVTPQSVFTRLAENITSGLPPVGEGEDIAALAEGDWRYGFVAGVEDDMAFVPAGATLVVCVTVAAMIYLWPSAWRIIRKELGAPSADVPSQAAGAGFVDAPPASE
ncbi:hypothetical protein [Conyzicola sp.]|uniref:hypothetical protein n=1 Tax=Conyzicola sp. TaxID=1969404 RepID=UPI0039897253